jgi:hypothetical protein
MPTRALIINSNSNNLDCLGVFFTCMEKFVGSKFFSNVYLFIDPVDHPFPRYVEVVNYNPKDNFRDQMVSCLKRVSEDIILYCNDDYLFYDNANLELAEKLIDEIVGTKFSFVKFVHTNLEAYTEHKPKLLIIDKDCENTFSQTLSFWKTKDFLEIHENCPPSEIGSKGETFGHLEVFAKQVSKELGIAGLCYYNNEKQRGQCHFDSDIFPHIASALVKGKWNLKEYSKELFPLLLTHQINLGERGLFQ